MWGSLKGLEPSDSQLDCKSAQQSAAKSVDEFAPDGIDALIVNAGVLGGGFNGLAADSVSSMKENMEVNVYGAINSTNAFLPLLRKKQSVQPESAPVAETVG